MVRLAHGNVCRGTPGCADILAELSIKPELNHQLVPPHMKPVLAAKGLDIDNLVPLSREQMMARLD